jgi:glucose-1-phosphate cytidylyltransferase
LDPVSGAAMAPTIILAGGRGSRLGSLSDEIPKPMVAIDDRPILRHILLSYERAGRRDFIICLGYKGGVVKDYFRSLRDGALDWDMDFSGGPGEVRMLGERKNDLGRVILAETGPDAMTGARLKRVEKYVSSPTFLMTYGDGLSDVDIPGLVRFHRAHGKIGTLTAVHPPARFGELILDGDRVVDFGEKRRMGTGRINGGFMVFNRDVFDFLSDDPDCNFESDVLPRLSREGELMAFPHDGFWQCMDTPRDVEYLRDLCAKGEMPWLS